MIRFDGSDRTYTVNCGPWFTPGTRVMVKMREGRSRLQVAEVVSHGESANVCRHSVVCSEEGLATYVDPDNVHTMEEFDRFLRSHGSYPLPMKYTGRLFDDKFGDWSWTTGYFPVYRPEKLKEGDYIQGAGTVILIGPHGLGIHRGSLDGRLFLRYGEGGVEFDYSKRINLLPLDPDRLFQSYMEWAGIERGEEVEMPQRDTSLQDIASAIGNTGGGVYLSDGVWL